MSRIIRLIGHLLLILAGYVCAVVAASVLIRTVMAVPGDWYARASGAGMAFDVAVIAAHISYFAFVPAALGIFLSEIFSRRDWLWHMLGGAVIGICALVLLAGDMRTALVTGGIDRLGLTLASGLVGGLAYWLVAGRRAGVWLRAKAAGQIRP